MIARLGWQSVSREGITPVNVSQAVFPSAIRESVRLFAQRQMPGSLSGGGRM
jgi:hypothetical protein